MVAEDEGQGIDQRVQGRTENALVHEIETPTFLRAREIGKLAARVFTFAFTASVAQAFGAANRILDEGMTAVVYGSYFLSATPESAEWQRFELLRRRADLIIRLFIEDYGYKLGELNKNPRIRNAMKKIEEATEDDY